MSPPPSGNTVQEASPDVHRHARTLLSGVPAGSGCWSRRATLLLPMHSGGCAFIGYTRHSLCESRQEREHIMEQSHQQSQRQPRQHQDQQPGLESAMTPRPRAEDPTYHGSGKLWNKAALITGGDSGIGRAVAILFAKEAQILPSCTSTSMVTLKRPDAGRGRGPSVRDPGRRRG